MYLPFENRQKTTLALLERGHEARMFLSADSCGTLDWFPPDVVGQMAEAGMVKDWDIRLVPEQVIPELREGGMTDEQLEQMMVRNPVSWLTSG
jgi:phosphotriesterase-related protein